MGAFKILRGRPLPIPTAQTVNFYTKQRTGYGASLLGYTGAGTLSITSQKDASNASVTIFQIAQNALSWKGASSTYGAAPPASLNGPYTVVVTDGTYSSTVTIPIVSGSCIREMTPASLGGRWTTDSMYTTDGTAASSRAGQLWEITQDTTAIALGDTIWARDGHLNPTGLLYYFEPKATSSYSGSGRITIRSETVDTSVDQWGYPNRQHGFKIGRLYFHPDTGASKLATPFDFVDLGFYLNVDQPSFTCLLTCDHNFIGSTVSNCGFQNGTSVSLVLNNGGINDFGESCTADHCTFKNLGQGVSLAGTAPTVTNCVFYTIRDGDCIDIGGGDAFNWTITDNVAFDIKPTSGGHCDFLQFTGLTSGNTGPMGTVARNILANEVAQFIFIADHVSGNFTSGTIEHNIGHSTAGNQIATDTSANVVIRWNTTVTPEAGNPGSISATGFANATVTRNLANAYNFAGQTGTVTLSPNPNVSVSHTTVAYLAVFPGYKLPTAITDFSLAALKAIWTPSVAGFAVVQSSGCLDAAGALNTAT